VTPGYRERVKELLRGLGSTDPCVLSVLGFTESRKCWIECRAEAEGGFHLYPDGSRTPLEEQLFEAAGYAASSDGCCRLHLTVSGEHLGAFEELVTRVVSLYEQRFGLRFELSFSEQKASTDSLAVDDDGGLFCVEGAPLFRAGGHGALIANLADIDADLVFDCRFLPNPHWIPDLRPLTGRDGPVSEYVLGHDATQDFLDQLDDMLAVLMPSYVSEGKSYLSVAFGCTGGRHRSVAIAETVAEMLRGRGFDPVVSHRDVER